MEIKYEIKYLEELVLKHIPALPYTAKTLIKRVIEQRLLIDPVSFGKPLRYSLKGHRRLRVGDYRIVYRIELQNVIVVAIKHHKEIYEDF